MNVRITYGRDGAGMHTAQSPQYRGLLARGKSDAEAARNLQAMIELVERSRGHANAAPTELIYDNVA
jgi:predicted RNase H-like HicB family nuclease